MPSVRPIVPDDFPDLDRLLMDSFSSPRSYQKRLVRFLSLEPGGWLAAFEGDRPIGMGGVTAMGRVAYIGLVAVDAAHRGRGVASGIMRRLIGIAADRGCETILLDASEAGLPLYEKLGFEADDLVGVWSREKDGGATGGARPRTPMATDVALSTLAEAGRGSGPGVTETARRAALRELAEYDASAWGADRHKVIASYAADDPSLLALARGNGGQIRGYAILQMDAGVLGPWVASDPSAARALLDWALGRGDASPETAYVPAANEEGVALVSGAGFRLIRSNTHMRLGPALPASRRRLIYSQATLALG